MEHGIPAFLDQLAAILRSKLLRGSDVGPAATALGGDLLRGGFTVAQVVHDYGDVCQPITELAIEQQATITTEEFPEKLTTAAANRREDARSGHRAVGQAAIRSPRPMDCFAYRRCGRAADAAVNGVSWTGMSGRAAVGCGGELRLEEAHRAVAHIIGCRSVRVAACERVLPVSNTGPLS
ncbi:MAG TPA: hypothetical protein VF516_34140 [Kofleriaceae bacterium]